METTFEFQINSTLSVGPSHRLLYGWYRLACELLVVRPERTLRRVEAVLAVVCIGGAETIYV